MVDYDIGEFINDKIDRSDWKIWQQDMDASFKESEQTKYIAQRLKEIKNGHRRN